MDNAINAEAAAIKGIHSPVAGRAQILVVPDLEAGNMLAKNMIFLGQADAAGIVLGATVPIILTSRADGVRTRIASTAIGARVRPSPGRAARPSGEPRMSEQFSASTLAARASSSRPSRSCRATNCDWHSEESSRLSGSGLT